ncbi:MAG: DNA mismatch repair endonuclease MutL [Planctomycetes bacterium]|nr:DNA mismatch repair endonuclease MutL [Planctomycetota bacterium]
MTRIRELPPDLVDKIAAGEVVERPASVVKELLENALDAGARRVEVAVEEGGLRLVRVTDDGDGMTPDELPLAVRSHATSKIRTVDDLFAIRSLGFRGEALASIAAVSHLRVASRPRDARAGAELRVAGGRLTDVVPAGLPPGTTIEAADLFFNVPARRAFVSTSRAELRAVTVEVRRQALARPEVTLRLVADGQVVIDAPATDEPRERLAQLLGRDLAEDLIAVPRAEEEAGTLRGYVSPCDRSRGDSQQQFFFLNGRTVRDPTLLSAVRQAYANLLPPRRHPTALLWLDVDPADVDVNVHPQKADVRFRRDREVFHLIVRAVRAALQRGGMVAELHLARRPAPALAAAPGAPRPAAPAVAVALATAGAPGTAPAPPAEVAPAPPGRFLQVHRRYVLEETPQGLRLLDPHALHERILYEEILARLAAGPLESQRFLFPQVVTAGPVLLAALDERRAALEALGFEVAAFGRDALAVHAAPRLLAADRVAEAITELLGEPEALGPHDGGGGLLHDVAAGLACKAAVKFGQALGDAEVEALLRRRDEVNNGHCCPHGRPTALTLTLDELDRRFGRQGLG